MGIPVLCIGASASGKSTSMRNLDRKNTVIYNVAGKPLPFKGKFEKMITISDVDSIISSLRKNTSNCYVIDDSQYLMAFKLIDRVNEKGYEKYTEIAKDFKALIDTIVHDTSDDTIVYFLHHTETTDDGRVKAKTSGKMIDNWLTLEGLFSIVIMAVVNDNKHLFITQNDGTSTCKSPMDMLENPMENDLALVDKAIRDYYELKPTKKEKKVEKPSPEAVVEILDKMPVF